MGCPETILIQETTARAGPGDLPMHDDIPAADIPAEARRYLAATPFVDAGAPEVAAFVARALAGLPAGADARERAVRLFLAVRDGLRYDPFSVPVAAADYRASAVATAPRAFCVTKAILLAACLRHCGIPAAPGFADVRNHLNTPKLSALMGTDIFIWHGYVQIWLGAHTVKVTPAFNAGLCEKFGVKPLDFDGTADALFHEFDRAGRRHMEYVRDRGLFAEAPVDTILAEFAATYPTLMAMRAAGAAAPAFVPGPG
jgi:transglutaminase-like putative cysteine protease